MNRAKFSLVKKIHTLQASWRDFCLPNLEILIFRKFHSQVCLICPISARLELNTHNYHDQIQIGIHLAGRLHARS